MVSGNIFEHNDSIKRFLKNICISSKNELPDIKVAILKILKTIFRRIANIF